jgi:hypothetical protein
MFEVTPKFSAKNAAELMRESRAKFFESMEDALTAPDLDAIYTLGTKMTQNILFIVNMLSLITLVFFALWALSDNPSVFHLSTMWSICGICFGIVLCSVASSETQFKLGVFLTMFLSLAFAVVAVIYLILLRDLSDVSRYGVFSFNSKWTNIYQTENGNTSSILDSLQYSFWCCGFQGMHDQPVNHCSFVLPNTVPPTAPREVYSDFTLGAIATIGKASFTPVFPDYRNQLITTRVTDAAPSSLPGCNGAVAAVVNSFVSKYELLGAIIIPLQLLASFLLFVVMTRKRIARGISPQRIQPNDSSVYDASFHYTAVKVQTRIRIHLAKIQLIRRLEFKSWHNLSSKQTQGVTLIYATMGFIVCLFFTVSTLYTFKFPQDTFNIWLICCAVTLLFDCLVMQPLLILVKVVVFTPWFRLKKVTLPFSKKQARKVPLINPSSAIPVELKGKNDAKGKVVGGESLPGRGGKADEIVAVEVVGGGKTPAAKSVKSRGQKGEEETKREGEVKDRLVEVEMVRNPVTGVAEKEKGKEDGVKKKGPQKTNGTPAAGGGIKGPPSKV